MTRERLAGFGRGAAFLAAFLIPISVFGSQIALAVSVLALAAARSLRAPPARLAILIFILLTLLSLAFSAEPVRGWPQIRKFYVWLMLPAVYSALRGLEDVRRLLLGWAAAGGASALWSFNEYYTRWSRARAAGENFYLAYVGDRISGFMSHWMTFSGQMMVLALLLAALLLWRAARGRWLIVPLLLSSVALVLAQTRGMWLAAFAGAAYLIGAWRIRWLAALPLAAAVLYLCAPPELQQRARSIVRPNRAADSNQHRIVCWRTGWEMIRAHPLVGVGPEHVAVTFERYIPPDIPRPLPTGFYGHLHNIYIHYAAERGVPAMLALVAFLLKVLIDFARAARASPQSPLRRAVLHGAAAAVIAIAVSGVTELNLGDSEVLAMFLATVACGYAAAQSKEPDAISA